MTNLLEETIQHLKKQNAELVKALEAISTMDGEEVLAYGGYKSFLEEAVSIAKHASAVRELKERFEALEGEVRELRD